ncbi:MAG: hypothetical protein JWP87_4816 [Labilithrix sp.]|nr:hypothetical protein [Labilithrix sp.]
MPVEHGEPGLWCATLRRPLSMFDQCVVTVTVASSPEDSTTHRGARPYQGADQP